MRLGNLLRGIPRWSERASSGRRRTECGHPVGVAAHHDGPDRPGWTVGQRDRHKPERLAGEQRIDRRICRAGVMLVAPDERRHPGDQETPQVLVAHLQDPAEPLLSAAGAVQRREAEPCGELTAAVRRVFQAAINSNSGKPADGELDMLKWRPSEGAIWMTPGARMDATLIMDLQRGSRTAAAEGARLSSRGEHRHNSRDPEQPQRQVGPLRDHDLARASVAEEPVEPAHQHRRKRESGLWRPGSG